MKESVMMRQEITGQRGRGGNCPKGQAERRRKKFASEWGFREETRPRTTRKRFKI